MGNTSRIAVSLTLVLGAAACQQEQPVVSYSQTIEPILMESCLPCHSGGGEGSEASGFSVASYEDVMKGTKYGSVIEPGDRTSSTFYRLVAGKTDPKIHMPPHSDESLAKGRMEPLTAEQIEAIGTWIDQGARNN